MLLDHSDFLTVPLAILTIAIVCAPYTLGALVLAAGGFSLWTFIEYWVHRALHMKQFPKLRAFHMHHHQKPLEATGGTLYSTLIIAGITALGIAFPPMAPALIGLLAGYDWFIVLHHLEHHLDRVKGPIVGGLAKHHAVHHHEGPSRMFGVSTTFWDKLFGTA